MILKYRTTSLSSPPHTPYSYIDNISHFSPIYNPTTSTLTVNLTLRTPIYPSTHPFISSVPTSLILNDLAFLLTDEGKFLDKVFDPNTSSNTSNSNPFYQQKPYKPYNNNRPYYRKPYYKNQSYQSTQSSTNSDITESESDDSDTID